LGIGSAFMPLLTIATAEIPPADAGLGSGITNVSQQVSGSLGLAVLGTIATNHTRGLLAAHHSTVTSLIAGYHLAFLVGAAAIVTGAALAIALLRPRAAQRGPQLAAPPSEDEQTAIAAQPERQAA
ncbi:MAG: MFS transporter, partial [Solirubrobacterales bacterium]|nr:MFS transporter [Solirubrobacterales bacterium]